MDCQSGFNSWADGTMRRPSWRRGRRSRTGSDAWGGRSSDTSTLGTPPQPRKREEKRGTAVTVVRAAVGPSGQARPESDLLIEGAGRARCAPALRAGPWSRPSDYGRLVDKADQGNGAGDHAPRVDLAPAAAAAPVVVHLRDQPAAVGVDFFHVGHVPPVGVLPGDHDGAHAGRRAFGPAPGARATIPFPGVAAPGCGPPRVDVIGALTERIEAAPAAGGDRRDPHRSPAGRYGPGIRFGDRRRLGADPEGDHQP